VPPKERGFVIRPGRRGASFRQFCAEPDRLEDRGARGRRAGDEMGLHAGRQVRHHGARGLAPAYRAEAGVIADVGARQAAGGRPARTGRGSVVTQDAHQVRHRQAPFAGLQEFAGPALPPAGVGKTGEKEIGIAAAEIEIVAAAAPAALDRMGDEIGRGHIPPAADGDAVGDAPDVAHLLGGPMAAGGLQDPGLSRVRDQEAVVVEKLSGIPAIAALAVFLQKADDDVPRFARRAAPLQRQAQKVHADQARGLFVGHLGENGLVADGHTVFVAAHFGTPDPERLAQKDLEGPLDLGHFDIGASDNVALRMLGGRNADDFLGLPRVSVRILGEQRRPVGGGVSEHNQRVAHGPPERYRAPKTESRTPAVGGDFQERRDDVLRPSTRKKE